jgi:hypothetical protein
MISMAGASNPPGASAQSVPAERNRIASAFHFTASERMVVFSIPTAADAVGLLIADRVTGEQRLIHDDKSFLLYPRLSSDGKRLLFVRSEAYLDEKQKERQRRLVVCAVDTWRCRVWLQTTATIHSPLELDQNRILFSSSPVVTGWNGRPVANKHDFYLVTPNSQPERISSLGLPGIGSISFARDRLFFTAQAAANSPILEQSSPLGPGSEIYSLKFDPTQPKLETPLQPLKPLFVLDGASTEPVAAPDGRIAFTLRKGRAKTRGFHFDLVIAAPDGKIERQVEATGWAFSRPAFVGDSVLANETFDKHYEVKVFGPANAEPKVVATLEYRDQAIKALTRVTLTFE